MSQYLNYADEVYKGLTCLLTSDSKGADISIENAFDIWIEKTQEIALRRGTVFLCGNGASASMAEHISHDCFQNGDLQTYTVSEVAHITAISNDLSYEEVFAYRISKMCTDKDMLITISSSGNSPNVIKAISAAREKGMFIVTVSGKDAGNKSRKLGDLNFYVPLDTYGLVESAHAVLLHSWLDIYMDKYKGGRH